MGVFFIIVSVVALLLSGALVGLILMQKKNAGGITAISGGSGGGDTYWDKNKGRSVEGQLEKATKIIGFLFFVAIFLSNLIK